MKWKITNMTDKEKMPVRCVDDVGNIYFELRLNPQDYSFYANDGPKQARKFDYMSGRDIVMSKTEIVGVHILKPGESIVTITKPVADKKLLIEQVDE